MLACHDLRTPLATVHGFAQTLTRLGELEDPVPRYFEMTQAATGQMAALLDELSLGARIAAGRYEPVRSELDTLEAARSAAGTLGEERVEVSGEGAEIEVDRDATGRAIAALARCALRHGGVEQVQLTVLGPELAMPLLVAPTAFQRLADPDGELATARAAAAAGTVMCLSTLSSVSPADLAAAAPGAPQWFQLYWSQDRGFTDELVTAVKEAGFRALVLTVDFPVAGRRERDVRAAFALPDDLPLPNLPVRLERQDFHRELGAIVDPALTWRDLEWLRSTCDLPLVVKGVLTAEDALLAAEHGAAAVIVSNHGGRQLDRVPATLDVLPEVVEAAGGRVEVLPGAGLRRGADVAEG